MRAALRSDAATGPVWSSNWPEFVHRVAHVGAQHVLAEELVEHLAHRALQKRHAAGMAGAVPGIGAVRRVMGQRAEERRRQGIQIGRASRTI